MKKHGRNLHTYHCMTKANLNRLRTVSFQVSDIPEKTKLWRQWKNQQLPGVGGERRMSRQSTGFFRAMKILCIILQWWMHNIIHSSKPIQCTTPNIDCGLWVMTCIDVGSSGITSIPLWGQVELGTGDMVYVLGQKAYGKSCVFIFILLGT